MSNTALHVGPDGDPDRYRLLQSIGRGGEAVLYLAEVELAGAAEPVVVKILDSPQTMSAEEFGRVSGKWREQAELLRFVARPGVVGVREHFEGPSIHRPGREAPLSGRSLVLVMNHVDGLDLRDWRAELTLATSAERRQVVRALEQLADTLDWLHSGRATPSGRTVVHGDLSPGNVMVDGHGQATIVDFGLSKLTARHQTAEVWFTPGYAAPEVFEGLRTPATDRYAFGAIACFLLSGENPPATPEQLAAAIGALPQVAGLSDERRRHILSIAAADPEDRPASLAGWVKELRHGLVTTTTATLSAAGGGAPAPAPPRAPGPVPAAPAGGLGGRRNMVLAAGAGAAVAALVTVIALQASGDDGGGNQGGGSRDTPSPSASPVQEQPSADPTGSSSATPSEEAPTPDAPASISLTTLESVDDGKFGWFAVGGGTLNAKTYETALVPDGYDLECSGSAAYNLSREWKTLTMIAGVDDTSEHSSARINVEVDGRSVYTGVVGLGKPKTLTLDVSGGLRLGISYADPADSCEMGTLVLADPTLKE